MSSSRRSSPSRAPRRGGACPVCGAGPVLPVTGDVVLRIRGRRYKIADVPHERCEVCRNRIFGIEASGRFDAVVLGRRSRRVA